MSGGYTAMFERFTEKAIKVIMLAQEEARRLGHNFVGTEQILLGLNRRRYWHRCQDSQVDGRQS